MGTEALKSCLPHQLDLRTGQLWAEGQAMLQLHQQRPIPKVEALLMTAVVLPPDSEIMAPFVVSGGRLGPCALVEPSRSLTEEYGVVVGHTLVDASSWSASVLMINPNADEIVLPCQNVWESWFRYRLCRWLSRIRNCPAICVWSCQTIWRTLWWDLILRWGRRVGDYCATFFIGINMCFRRQENRRLGGFHRFNTRY